VPIPFLFQTRKHKNHVHTTSNNNSAATTQYHHQHHHHHHQQQQHHEQQQQHHNNTHTHTHIHTTDTNIKQYRPTMDIYFETDTWLSTELLRLSTELRLSTPGNWTLVSQPRPLQKSSTEWANLAGASSSTLPTPSTFSKLERVWKASKH
jgi:hypothetical protein